MTGTEDITLGEAATRFLGGLPAEKRAGSQQEIYRFVRWYGWEQAFAGLTGSQVDKYAEQMSQSDADYSKKLGLVRTFLARARKEGWIKRGLATHLKSKKGKNGAKTAARSGSREATHVSRQGRDDLKAELASLLEKRPQLIEDIRRAAADKDFRENAPLHAAREQRGHLEGRIKEIEEILGGAIIIDEEREAGHRIGIGDDFALQDLAGVEEVRYTLVGPTEVDAANGKISAASPIGKAAIGRAVGEEIGVTVPAGKRRYRVTRVGGQAAGAR